MLFAEFSRSFEPTRTDFTRVVPFEDAAEPRNSGMTSAFFACPEHSGRRGLTAFFHFMNTAEPRIAPRRKMRPQRLFPFFALALLAFPFAAAESSTAPKQAPAEAEDAAVDDIISLAAYNAKADRIEDFGLRVESARYPFSSQLTSLTTVWFAKFAPQIVAVVPNTAAAKAGLQPGDRILKSEGQSTIGGAFSRNRFDKLQAKKWADVRAGTKNVTWTLEIESPGTKAVRTVKLAVPTPPPHWGASTWSAPAGRNPSTVAEPGPLAERSRAILDQGIWRLLEWPLSSVSGENMTPGSEPTATGYEWHVDPQHSIVVTQSRGRTQVFFETSSSPLGRRIYLTSPSGALEKAWQWTRKENIALAKARTPELAAKVGELPRDDAKVRAGFDHELDLWTTKVGKVSPRWPFELKPGYDANAIFATLAPQSAKPASPAARALAEDFLKLRPATDAEKALFAAAYGKLGADADQWAYRETSRGIEDKRVLVTRVDPSQPETSRSVLLSVDGRAPTSVEIETWRADGGDTPKPLGDIPPLTSLVDLQELRIAQEEDAALVFELPVRRGSAEIPGEKLQALFRVNKMRGAVENVTVKLRESFRVAGMAKIVEAGLEIRFQMLDPALAPQPVLLKMGGGVRVLLVKLSRSFEATRTDFKRVVPVASEAALSEK